MDVFGHALLTFILFHRVEWVWAAVIFSVFPDILGNAPIMAQSLITRGKLLTGRTAKSRFAKFWRPVYRLTHSLPLPLFFGLLLSIYYNMLYWPILGWIIHVLIDVPLHNDKEGNAIPFLWPLSNYKIQGVAWWNPRVSIALWLVIAGLGAFVYF